MITDWILLILAVFVLTYHTGQLYERWRLSKLTTVTVSDAMVFEEDEAVEVNGEMFKIVSVDIENNVLTIDRTF